MKHKVFRSEKDVKRDVRALLDKHKWFWWMPPSNAYGRTGISDFHAFRGGVFMVIETKFGDNVVTPMQKGFLQSIASAGGFAFIVDEKRLGTFATWLQAFDAAIKRQSTAQPIDADLGGSMLDTIHALTEGYQLQ